MSEALYTASELAKMRLPGLPRTKQGVRCLAERRAWPFVEREGRGGATRLYARSALPLETQAALIVPATTDVPALPDMAERVDSLPEKHREIARARYVAVAELADLIREQGYGLEEACRQVAKAHALGARTLRRFYDAVRKHPRDRWFLLLLPQWKGRCGARRAEMHPEAWRFFRSDVERAANPSLKACYRRMRDVARHEGWTPVPGPAAFRRRLRAEDPAVHELLTKGEEALARLYPAQRRTRAHLHALQAVNADGHKFDVLVRWPGIEKPVRPILVAFQDLYSGKILAYRVDLTEHADLVRLAFADMASAHGIPGTAYLDNGRAFAAKKNTGGAPTRYRFIIREDDAPGIFVQLGVQVRWTKPYSGQSKPIERAWKDFGEQVSRHPAFEGAYTGNSTENKPHNYGSRAVELADFLAVLDVEVRRHNAQDGRTSETCNGRSFDATFAESYAASPIRKPTEAESRLLLLTAERRKVRSDVPQVHFKENAYHADALISLRGEEVIIRFDPDRLKAGVYVYRLDGSYVAFAECIEATGFDDMQAAKDHEAARRAWVKSVKEQAAREREVAERLSPEQLAAMHLKAHGVELAPPSAVVLKARFGGPKVPVTPKVPMGPVAEDRAREERERRAEAFIDAYFEDPPTRIASNDD